MLCVCLLHCFYKGDVQMVLFILLMVFHLHNIPYGVNALPCRNFPPSDFIFPYPLALLKLWLHIVLDGLFSLVVISALYLIRSTAFLQDKLSDVRKA